MTRQLFIIFAFWSSVAYGNFSEVTGDESVDYTVESSQDEIQACQALRSLMTSQRKEIEGYTISAMDVYHSSLSLGRSLVRTRYRRGNIFRLDSWHIILTDRDLERVLGMVRLDFPDLMQSYENNTAEFHSKNCHNLVSGCEDGMYLCGPNLCCPE